MSRRGFIFRTAICVAAVSMVFSGSAHSAGEAKTPDPSAQYAIARARADLSRYLGIPVARLALISVKAATWSDGGMGCARPGTPVTTAFVFGHIVTLSARGRTRRVHVGNETLLCGPFNIGKTLTPKRFSPYNIDQLSELARGDLAAHIAVPLGEIELLKATRVQWSNSALECPSAGESVRTQPVPGYKLLLRHRQRTFTYHTSQEGVRACPEIQVR